jgi:hypothetical protein
MPGKNSYLLHRLLGIRCACRHFDAIYQHCPISISPSLPVKLWQLTIFLHWHRALGPLAVGGDQQTRHASDVDTDIVSKSVSSDHTVANTTTDRSA